MAAAIRRLFVHKPSKNALISAIKPKQHTPNISRSLVAICRSSHSSALPNIEAENSDNEYQSVKPKFTNRNPRSVEYEGRNKPRGYGTQHYRRDFYNKLHFVISNRHIKAFVKHNSGAMLVSASTTEFTISKHLYKTTDISAAVNIARVLVDRCKDVGLNRVCWELKFEDKHKQRTKAFVATLKESGMLLNEPRRVIPLETFYSNFKPRRTRMKWKSMPNSYKRKFI